MSAMRYAVLGSGGSGKTWFSNRLGSLHNLPVVHLDELFYSGRTGLSSSEFLSKQEEAVNRPDWVIEGNYQSSLELRLQKADVVVLLDVHPLLCAWSVLRRHYREPEAGARNVLNIGFIWYILTYRSRMRPIVLDKIIAARIERRNISFIHLRSRKAASQFIREQEE